MSDPTPLSTEELLDRCIEAAQSGGDPEELLRQHPDLAGDVRPLLALATELGELPEPAVSVAGAMRMLTHLSLESPAASPAKPKIRFFSRAVLGRAAAVFLCISLLGWGTVAASSDALPGSPLYHVKLLTERVHFFLTVNGEAKAELRIVLSEERLKEAILKHDEGGEVDEALLRAMLDEAQKALDAAPDIPEARRGLFLSRVAYQADFQKKVLEQLKGRVGPAEQLALAPFINACSERCGRMCKTMGCGNTQGGWMCTCPTCD
jgi:hypothetical protein